MTLLTTPTRTLGLTRRNCSPADSRTASVTAGWLGCDGWADFDAAGGQPASSPADRAAAAARAKARARRLTAARGVGWGVASSSGVRVAEREGSMVDSSRVLKINSAGTAGTPAV